MRLFFILLFLPILVIAQVAPENLDINENPTAQSRGQNSPAEDPPLFNKNEPQQSPERDKDFSFLEEEEEKDPVKEDKFYSIPYDI